MIHLNGFGGTILSQKPTVDDIQRVHQNLTQSYSILVSAGSTEILPAKSRSKTTEMPNMGQVHPPIL